MGRLPRVPVPSLLTSSDVHDQVLNALLGKELGEEAGPVGLDGDAGSLGDGDDVVGGDLEAVVGQDQGLSDGKQDNADECEPCGRDA